jgi:hypothetical protein
VWLRLASKGLRDELGSFMLTPSATSLEAIPTTGKIVRYFSIVVVSGSAMLAAFLFMLRFLPYDGPESYDFFSQIPRKDDASWYRNFGGAHIPQIQDQDVFYSNIGSSVAAAKRAHIIFLGPSFVSYAVDRDTLNSVPPLGKLNVYNMAFIGIRGGEFSRQVVDRWEIRPSLWVINVDDQFVHFFSKDLSVTLGPEKIPIGAVGRNRIRGYLTVVGRDLRWRIEDAIGRLQNGHFSPSGLYRNISNGDIALGANPAYLADNNKPMPSARDQNCHTTPEIIEYARSFLKDVGGHVVLTLVPHSQSCLGQAKELAKALNVELVAPPFDGLTTVDGGGHLDKHGAERFTSYLAAELVKTEAFKEAFKEALAGKTQKAN